MSNNASDRELLELVLAQVSKLTMDMDGMKSEMRERFNQVDERFNQIEQRIDKIEKTVIKIEHEHGEKLSALFDGYKQNSDKLDRIETEVSKHEEVILRRIR
ncbi:hypothetical protein [Biomaibacter acetigenes]|nr:hypothetical protein [Biomaibacter acetigenes]